MDNKSNLPVKKGDRLDAIRSHLLDDTELPETQQEMLERYKAAFAWMCKNKTPTTAIKKAQKVYGLSYPQAAKVIRDSIQLFGDVHNYKKEGLRQLLFDRFMRLGDKAAEENEFISAEKLWDKAAKIYDLYNQKTQGGTSGKRVYNLIISSNPEVLKKKEEDRIIDIDHKEEHGE